MKSLSLYVMTENMLALLEQDDITQEQLTAAFGEITAKDNRICHLIRDIEASAKAHKEEEERLSARRKAMENKVKRLKALIQESMERLEIDKLPTGTFTLAIHNNPPALEIVSEEEIPDAYRLIIPEQHVPDKERIKQALKDGADIPGARLIQGRSLRIR